MSDELPPFGVSDGDAASVIKSSCGDEISSPSSPPGVDFDKRERKVWDYICARLREAGLEHMTNGLAISIVVRTYVRWIDAERYLKKVEDENSGTYFITTPNGHVQPHQAFYVVKNLKQDLLKWLPECCLTLPSVATVRQKMGAPAPQDDLFASLVEHGQSHPSAA